MLTVDNADSDDYKVLTGISFFRDRKSVLSPSTNFDDDNVDSPDFIVITTQEVFKANSEPGKKIIEIAKKSYKEKNEAKKQEKNG